VGFEAGVEDALLVEEGFLRRELCVALPSIHCTCISTGDQHQLGAGIHRAERRQYSFFEQVRQLVGAVSSDVAREYHHRYR